MVRSRTAIWVSPSRENMPCEPLGRDANSPSESRLLSPAYLQNLFPPWRCPILRPQVAKLLALLGEKDGMRMGHEMGRHEAETAAAEQARSAIIIIIAQIKEGCQADRYAAHISRCYSPGGSDGSGQGEGKSG